MKNSNDRYLLVRDVNMVLTGRERETVDETAAIVLADDDEFDELLEGF